MARYKEIKKQESGRSMIEMIAVLAIMGLITAGAFVLINSASRSQKIAHFDDEVNLLAANARALTAEAGNFKSLPAEGETYSDNQEKEEKGMILANRILNRSAGTTNVIGGEYSLVKTGTGNNDGTGFAVIVVNVDQDWCAGLHGHAYPHGVAACDKTDGTGTILTITFTE